MLDYAVIGNGRIAALTDTRGRIVWWCYPRFDGDPVFSRLVSGDVEQGFCDVVLARATEVVSRYVRNSAIVETIITSADGSAVRITDFAPRFSRFERMFHPPMLMRRIEPLAGLPRITVRMRPTFDYGHRPSRVSLGSNHIRYEGSKASIRLTTDVPLSYIAEETEFALLRPLTLVIGPDEPFEGSVDTTGSELLDRTNRYWQGWMRALGVPLEWQSDVIRAAITLKLCSFDETGAIIAAVTTSIPEAPGTQRNWDYRFCWPRDAYFVIKALNLLGATETMESYLDYITSLHVGDDAPLKPVYGIVYDQPLTESVAPALSGFMGLGPVRVGNGAAEQVQHDIYGSIILATSQMFVDERLPRVAGLSLFRQLETLGDRARRFVAEPDSSLWEYRGRRRIHTYSAAMCWVACDRLARIAQRIGLPDRHVFWRAEAERLRSEIMVRGWNAARGAFVDAFEGENLDAAMLLLPELGLIETQDPRYIATVKAVGTELMKDGFVMRYTAPDDFGAPETAFLACQFWYIDALRKLGRLGEARELFGEVLRRRNRFGLLSEDLDPATGRLWGNLPQTYCMAGVINSAMGLSARWEDAWTELGTTVGTSAFGKVETTSPR